MLRKLEIKSKRQEQPKNRKRRRDMEQVRRKMRVIKIQRSMNKRNSTEKIVEPTLTEKKMKIQSQPKEKEKRHQRKGRTQKTPHKLPQPESLGQQRVWNPIKPRRT